MATKMVVLALAAAAMLAVVLLVAWSAPSAQAESDPLPGLSGIPVGDYYNYSYSCSMAGFGDMRCRGMVQHMRPGP